MNQIQTNEEQICNPVHPEAAMDVPAAIGEVLDCLAYCFVLFDAGGRYQYINENHRQFLSKLGADADALLGTPAFSWSSEKYIATIRRVLHRVSSTRKVIEREIWIAELQRVYQQHFMPMKDGRVALIAHDITPQKREKENADFMGGLQTAFLQADNDEDIVAAVANRVPNYFSLSRLAFAEVDSSRNVATTFHTFDRRPDADGAACYPIESFLDPGCLQDLYAGRLVAINNTQADARIAAGREDCKRSGTRALMIAPYCDGTGLKAVLAAVDDKIRTWRPDECQFFMEVATRTYLNFVRAKAESALRLSEARYRAMSEAYSRLNFRLSADLGVLLDMSGSVMPHISVPDADWIDHVVHPEDRASLRAVLGEAHDIEAPLGRELRIRCSEDTWADVFARIVPVRDAQGKVCEWFGAATDISARKRTEAELAVNVERLDLAIEGSGDGVIDFHGATGEHILSRRAWQILGYDDVPEVPPFKNWEDIVHPDDYEEFMVRKNSIMNVPGSAFKSEHRVRCRDGSWKWVLARVHVVARDMAGRPMRMTGLLSDVSEKRRAEEITWRQANFDALTGLPNRRLFRDRLDHELRKSARTHLPLALLFIDLDRFKEVNDLLGHAAGDQLLAQAAQRISADVRQSDTVARLGGDEFTAILPDLDNTQHAQTVARKIIAALATPFMLEGEKVYISASVGITLYPDDAANADDLVRNADQAMYAAKNAGRNRYSFFTPQMQTLSQNRLRLINDLRNALPRGQLELHFQPLVDLASGKVLKAEALLRWRHPLQGLIEPARFIPYAEESGLIGQIGDWVFNEAARCAREWQHELGHAFQVSVNTSPLQFSSQPPHLDWSAHLAALDLASSSILVEITEGILLNASPAVISRLEHCRDAGIEIAIDDFGTGYSSIAYLKKFDIDYLKIDQSFVRDLETSSGDRAIVRSTIVMAHELGLKVIAEGIETAGQRKLLREAGCDMGQGFLFSRPLPAHEFEAMLLHA